MTVYNTGVYFKEDGKNAMWTVFARYACGNEKPYYKVEGIDHKPYMDSFFFPGLFYPAYNSCKLKWKCQIQLYWKDKQEILQEQGNLCDEYAKSYKQLAHGLHQQNRMTNNYCIQLEHASAQKKIYIFFFQIYWFQLY